MPAVTDESPVEKKRSSSVKSATSKTVSVISPGREQLESPHLLDARFGRCRCSFKGES